MKVLCLLIIALPLVACSGENAYRQDMASSSAAADAAGMAAFKAGFYAFTQPTQQNCAMCHNTLVSPYFASSDINTAYSFFKTLADPADPTGSKIIANAGNGHCQNAICSTTSNEMVVQNLITEWATAVTSVAPTPTPGNQAATYFTTSMPIPANLPPLTKAPAVIRFPLSSFNIPSLANAILEIEINQDNPTEYRVSAPRIAGNTAAVSITGIHVYIRPATGTGMGTEDMAQGNAWDNITATAPVFALPSPLPTTPLGATPLVSTALAIQAQSAADVVTIGINAVN